MEEYYEGNLVLFTSYFKEEAEREDNAGYTMMFCIGSNITAQTTIQQLKADKQLQCTYWPDWDLMDDTNLPCFSVKWMPG